MVKSETPSDDLSPAPVKTEAAGDQIRALLGADEDREARRKKYGLKDFAEEPPSKEAWNRLLDGLAQARAILHDSPESWGFRQRQWSSLLAIWEVVDFLNRHRVVQVTKLDAPLWDIIAALKDTNEGLTHDLLTPAARGKPGKSTERQTIESIAILAMEELMEAGFKRKEAASRVANAIAKGSPSVRPRHGASLKDTVAGWRDRAKEARGGKDFTESLLYWRAYFEQHKRTGTPRDRADVLLSMLREPVTFGKGGEPFPN